MILYEIIYEKDGKFYTTHAHTDHSYYCEIEEDELKEMDVNDIEALIKELTKRLKRIKENEFLLDFHAKHLSGQNEGEEE